MKAKIDNKTQMWIVGLAGLLFMLLIALIVNWVRLGALSTRIKDTAAGNLAKEQQIIENDQAIANLSSDEHIDYVAYTELGLVEDGKELYTAN